MFGNIGLTFREEDFDGKVVGDIVDLSGKNYRITKKTRTVVAVERWYWFDKLIAKCLKKDVEE
jgi:hypothetical protein